MWDVLVYMLRSIKWRAGNIFHIICILQVVDYATLQSTLIIYYASNAYNCSIKSLIYNIFTYKVWTLNFYRRCQKFEVSFWRWEIPNSAGRSYRRRMLVVQHALIIIRWGKVFFVFQRILNGTYSNLLQHLVSYLSLHQRYTAGKKLVKKPEIPRTD